MIHRALVVLHISTRTYITYLHTPLSPCLLSLLSKTASSVKKQSQRRSSLSLVHIHPRGYRVATRRALTYTCAVRPDCACAAATYRTHIYAPLHSKPYLRVGGLTLAAARERVCVSFARLRGERDCREPAFDFLFPSVWRARVLAERQEWRCLA